MSNVVYYSKPCYFTYITALCHLFTNVVCSIDTYNCTYLSKYAFFRLFYILLCMIAHLMCNIRHWSGYHYQALLDVCKFHYTFLMKVCFITPPPPKYASIQCAIYCLIWLPSLQHVCPGAGEIGNKSFACISCLFDPAALFLSDEVGL